jgi:hypothetical protein
MVVALIHWRIEMEEFEVIEREPTEQELAEIEAEGDFLLEQQELEDYESHYGPVDYDDVW